MALLLVSQALPGMSGTNFLAQAGAHFYVCERTGFAKAVLAR